MSEEVASAGGDTHAGMVPTLKPHDLRLMPNPAAIDRIGVARDGAGTKIAGGKRSANRGRNRIPEAFFRSEEWRLVTSMVEPLKSSLSDLSLRIGRTSSPEMSPFARVRVHAVLDELNGNLQATADKLSKSIAADYLRTYLFAEIFPYFTQSRFANRAYYKPGGYAGDYLLMEMIYHNEPAGDGTLGRFIDDWCLNTKAARAVRGRRKFLKSLLARLCDRRRNDGSPIRILNLACGTNRELFDFLAECGYSERIVAIGMDTDPAALAHAHRCVGTFAHAASVRLLNDNAVRWAAGRNGQSLGPQDIIYTAGLTDYLGDRMLTALVERSFERLRKGGTLIVGNFGHNNPNKTFMDEILDWRLVHRSEEDLLMLFKGTRFGTNVEIEAEENGVNLFAIATKEA